MTPVPAGPEDVISLILIDITDQRQAGALRVRAERCRRLAYSVTDRQAVDTLLLMASEYDDKARTLQGH
jgi:hypothetical protein